MNKSYRIKTNVNPNKTSNIKIKLEQEVDQFEILSLKIDQEDEYNDFNCNHGVLVGRVIANGGVGIPNAKVSIFISLKEEDENNPDILAAYPYKTPRDTNENGKRYNLLPRVATQNGDGIYKPAQPFGSFPTKEELVTNPTLLDVYTKYYKYSTVTNGSGDYMLFGVPTGTQTVHMSVDTTDIGRFSMTPATLINNLGFSPSLFIEDGTRIKPSTDLSDLPNIETQEISVDVIPFCGDAETFDIGISRQDFRIRAELVNTFTIFGTTMTPPRKGFWNDFNPKDDKPNPQQLDEVYKFAGETRGNSDRDLDGLVNLNVPNSFRVGEMSETIMYLPPQINDADAEAYNFDPQSELVILSQDRYNRKFDNSGNFVYQIECNRRKIITSETGEDVEVPFDNEEGVFTQFRGLMLCEMTFQELDVDNFTVEFGTDENIYRSKFRIPQAFHTNVYIPKDSSTEVDRNPKEYLGKHKVFEGNKLYSISQFIATEKLGSGNIPDVNNPNPTTSFGDQITGNITLTSVDDSVEDDRSRGMLRTGQVMISGNDLVDIFSGEWLNFCIFFHQWGVIKDTNAGGGNMPYVTPLLYFVETDQGRGLFDDFWRPTTNTEPIGAGLINNFGFVTPLKIPLDFIELTKSDLIAIRDEGNSLGRGFRYNEIPNATSIKKRTSMFSGNSNTPVTSQSRREATFSDSTLQDTGFAFNNFDIPSNTSTNPYFYRGIGDTDLITYLDILNILD